MTNDELNKDRPETLKFLHDLDVNTPFLVLSNDYKEWLRAVLNYKPFLSNCLSEVVKPINKDKAISHVIKDNEGNVEDITMNNIDYVILTFQWDELSGKDLDIRVAIVKPNRNVVLGWEKAENDENYMHWAKDNTGTGRESVAIFMNSLQASNIAEDGKIEIDMSAFWYSERISGDVKIFYEVYRGGVLATDNFTFTNSGGTKVAEFAIASNVTAMKDQKDTGQLVAKAFIDVSTKSIRLTKVK